MKLLLVQHGEAFVKDVDPDRPLTERGAADIDRLAAFLGDAGIRVGRVMHSGKLRAQQTAARLAAILAPGVAPEVSGLIDPNDNPAAFGRQSGSWDSDVVVVGHLPFMARLVAHLVAGDQDLPVTAYRPGSVVCLQQDDEGRWSIVWMIRPELLGH